MSEEELEDKSDWIQAYMSWLWQTHPGMAGLIDKVELFTDGTINFITKKHDD